MLCTLYSNVVGELSDEHDAVSAFFAGMPAGTVSGAPKVRAMEIIDELEPENAAFMAGVSVISVPVVIWICVSHCGPPF